MNPHETTLKNMKNTMKYAFVGALFAAAIPFSAAAEKSVADVKKCSAVYESASKAIAKDPAKVLELVSKLVAANESCAADVVKAAIKTTKANKELVGQIVETAATAAPKQLSQIAAAAMSVAVDSSAQIAAVVNKINTQQGTAQGAGVKVVVLDTIEGGFGGRSGDSAGGGVASPSGFTNDNFVGTTPPKASR